MALSRFDHVQIVMTGDSLTTTPLSTAVDRAAYDLSRSDLPIEVANLGWGGGNSSVYGKLFDANETALQPSVTVYQAISRNDGSLSGPMQAVFSQLLSRARADQQRGVKPIFRMFGAEPSFDGNADAIGAFIDIRQQMNNLVHSGIPAIDGPAIIGHPNAPWRYVTGVSDDNTHLNSFGAEQLVSSAKRALQQVI